MTLVIGLTGGIASGKSVVSQMLADRGALVIDADKVGHEAYAPGSGCYEAVIAAFGQDIVGADGQIDRKALGGKVFGNAGRAEAARGHRLAVDAGDDGGQAGRVAREGIPVVVLEAAVLIEADWIPIVDQVWLVDRVAGDRARADHEQERPDGRTGGRAHRGAAYERRT